MSSQVQCNVATEMPMIEVADRPIRLLTYSSLYPSSAQPRHGIFVETRLRHLLQSKQVSAQVLAPVPWFPSSNPLFGEYARYARTPAQAVRHDVSIDYPRYFLLPKIGMTRAPRSMANASIKHILATQGRQPDFDVIDAHYFYPDGVAASYVADYFNKPFVVTARGTDISLIPDYPRPRRMILQTADRAAHIITVCQALKDSLVQLGADQEKITVLRNGVDLNVFQPLDRVSLRKQLHMTRISLLSVGHLITRKAHDIPIRGLMELPDVELFIAGDGVEETALRRLARDCGVAERVHFLGALSQAELTRYYSAADALVLASSREGWANVLLESMACGTPVIASDVWGTPEVVAAPAAGVLMDERTPAGLVRAFQRLFAAYPQHSDTRRYAEQFSWDATTQGQLAIFQRILQSST